MIRFGILFVCLLMACGGTPALTADPLDRRVDQQTASDILDSPDAKAKVRKPTAAAEVTQLELPPTPDMPSHDIDGDPSDWDRKLFKSFRGKNSIQEGSRYWRGASDASYRVGIDSDPGFLYILIDINDDKIILEDDGEVTDGVVLTLRDPKLDSFLKAVPPSTKVVELVKAESSILILPDGGFRRYGVDKPMPNDLGIIAVAEKKGGWVIEMALHVEAFEQVSSIPLNEMAFRVDLLDGDEPERVGTQTIFSMLPDRNDDDPRLAIVKLDGLLPHYPVRKLPPRKNAIGSWNVSGEQVWDFSAFEAVPKHWVTVDDRKAFEAALKKSDVLRKVCKTSNKDVDLIEAYQSRGGDSRVGLLMCGDRSTKSGKCPTDSLSEVIWVQLEADGDEWKASRGFNVFEKRLQQCAHQTIQDQAFYNELSLFPLDMEDANMWAVGWTRRTRQPGLHEDTNGITILNTRRRKPLSGSAVTKEWRSTTDERSRLDAKVYLAYVDDDEHLDLCQIETLHEQQCQNVDRGCVNQKHGSTILSTTQLYNPSTHLFERYEMSKHKGCNAEYDFAKRDGFLLMQTQGRVGFLPSPLRLEDGEDEGLDLY